MDPVSFLNFKNSTGWLGLARRGGWREQSAADCSDSSRFFYFFTQPSTFHGGWMSNWTLLPFHLYTCCFFNEHFLVGLTGSSQSEYVKTFVTVAKEEVNFSCGWVKILTYCNFKVGARCCVFNYRGRGGVSLASPRTYCASDPSDLGEVSGNKMYVWECREFEDVKLQNKKQWLKVHPPIHLLIKAVLR